MKSRKNRLKMYLNVIAYDPAIRSPGRTKNAPSDGTRWIISSAFSLVTFEWNQALKNYGKYKFGGLTDIWM